MRLLIISNMAHFMRDASVVGWGPAVQEIDSLAELFDDVRHVACMHAEAAPNTALPYHAPNVSLVPVPRAGGRRLADKLQIARHAPGYIAAILRELPHADVVHVRCPANISLIALAVLSLRPPQAKRWFKYAGNWMPDGYESWTSRLQRYWLEQWPSADVVTVNGTWPHQPSHVHSFFNPCLSEDELEKGKVAAVKKQLSSPLRLLFVGRTSKAKGLETVLSAASRLRKIGVSFRLDIVGGGPERAGFEKMAREVAVDDVTTFVGLKPRTEVSQYYQRAHLVLLPSKSEGWPKVLSEAMAFGAVPIASSVGSIPEYLERFGTGRWCRADDVQGYVDAVTSYIDQPNVWKQESERGLEAAVAFSYRHYQSRVRKLLALPEHETVAENAQI